VHGGGQDIRYFYDADGVLVRRTSGGVTTVFVGPHAEWNSSTGWTNYYHFNGQRVAMRNSAGVFWLHGDHLGSASLITTNAGATSGQLRYDPYGQRRVASGNIWTEYTFTDQRQELSVGLMDYDARLYSPLLARFISPDSLIPNAYNILDHNRYAYVRHNPLKYTDPTGHWVESAIDIALIGYDVYDISQNGLNWENGVSLAANVVGLIVPVATGLGAITRAAGKVDDVAKAITKVDEVGKTPDGPIYKVAQGSEPGQGLITNNATGKSLADMARYEGDALGMMSKFRTTVATTEYQGKTYFSAKGMGAHKIEKKMGDSYVSGSKHAEETLFDVFSTKPDWNRKIGVSHPQGPCKACRQKTFVDESEIYFRSSSK
jgi:RHS repeat-associated protein